MNEPLERARVIMHEIEYLVEELDRLGGVLSGLSYKDWEALRVNLRRTLSCARNMVDNLKFEDEKSPSK